MENTNGNNEEVVTATEDITAENKVETTTEAAAEVEAVTEPAVEEAAVEEAAETVVEEAAETAVEEAAETAVEEAAEASEEVAAEAVDEVATETAEEAVSTETAKKDSDLPRRIKIGVIVAGGIFIVGALAYAIAFMGGKTSNIVAETEVTKALEELEEKEEAIVALEVTEEVAQVEEEIVEDDPESLVNIVNGNRKYETCEYADAGVIIVKNGTTYGATNYKGQELVECKFEEIDVLPTKEGYFVLSNSKLETVTEETDGTTLSYEVKITDYTLFDNQGKKIYEGNSKVIPTGDFYILNVVDEKDERKNRNEYYKISDPGKPVLTLYTNGEFVDATFKDGVMAVYGFERPTTPQDDITPDKVKYGLMDEKGNVSWYKAPGVNAFKEVRAKWEELNKTNSTADAITPEVTPKSEDDSQEEGVVIDSVEPESDDDGGVTSDITNSAETADEEVAVITANATNVENTESNDDDTEEMDDADVTPGVGKDILAAEDNGPKYKMGKILNTPNQGYFLYVDKENAPYVLSMYTEKGEWYADINAESMKADSKAGFVVGAGGGIGNQLASYTFDGDEYHNYGTELLMQVGDKYVLCDIAKAKGMTSDKLNNSIVLGTYDYASLGESVFWVTYANKKYTYIEHNGKATSHVYEDATQFDYGYATVVEDGVAKVISDSFEDIQELEKTNTTLTNGDLFEIVLDGKSRYYILKDKKAAPTADLTAAVKPENGAGSGNKKK